MTMTAPPAKTEISDTYPNPTNAVARTGFGKLWDFTTGLLGSTGFLSGMLSASKILDPQALYNVSLVPSVAGNALTMKVTSADGSTALAAGNPATVSQRSSTLASGVHNVRNITADTTLVISSGSTLGHSNAVAGYLYWYLLDNAGTQELAVSSTDFGASGIVSTTAEGGAGAADSATVMYSATARSNVPYRKIGRSLDTQTTAGTWTAVPTAVELAGLLVGAIASQVDIFTVDGTWTKPAGAKSVAVICVGGGGSGGGGRGAAAAGSRPGGAGGGGGAVTKGFYDATDLAATVAVTVATAKTGGSGGSSANGSDGVTGTSSSFGAHQLAGGGSQGSAGINNFNSSGGGGGGAGANGGLATFLSGGAPYDDTDASVSRGSASARGGGGANGSSSAAVASGGSAEFGGGGGGSGLNLAAGKAGGSSIYGAGAGGGGGGVDGSNVEFAGGAGGASRSFTAGGGGTAGTTNGGTGGNGTAGDTTKCGGGGGGGGGQDSGTGGAGGNGAIPGGGGGGGGGGTTTGGAGGNGARGQVWVITYF